MQWYSCVARCQQNRGHQRGAEGTGEADTLTCERAVGGVAVLLHIFGKTCVCVCV